MRFLAALLALCAAAQAKETVIVLSWGDLIGHSQYAGAAQLDSPEHVRDAVKVWKSRGVDRVLFRVDDFRYLYFDTLYEPPVGNHYADYFAKLRAAFKADILRTAVEAARAEGIKIEMWISIYDEGAPPSVFYNDSVPFPWQGTFFRDHPEYLECDRSLNASNRKIHWGVPECWYPEVRKHFLEEIAQFSDHYPFDGVFLSIRSHSPPPEYADQFGFNQPVVDEYQRRYGVDIRRQNFDVEKWRALRGEGLTALVREVRAHLAPHGQTLSIGVAEGDHIGPPFGNMQIQWRTWISEHLIDELMLGHHTLERATYGNRWQRTWGYVQNEDDRTGLPPLAQDLRENYGPFCHRYGVKLFVDVPLGNFTRTYDDPTLGTGVQTKEDDQKFIAEMKAMPEVDGVIVDGRPFSVPNPQ